MADKLICSIDGCGKPARGRGWCTSHYLRWRKTGDPQPDKPFKTANGVAQRYFRDVVLSHKGSKCLIWPYAKSHGYAVLGQSGSRTRFVHRLACEEVHGAPPTGKHEAAHLCGNGHLGCVNPRHVAWKTSKENIAAQVTHGTRPRGSRRWNATLKESDVRSIRQRIGKESNKAIAAQYGVDASVISHIKRRKCWGWLN